MGVVNVHLDTRDRVLYIYGLIKNHPEGITVGQMIEEIYNDFGVNVGRVAVYQDINSIGLYLPLVKKKRGRKVYWSVKNDG